MDGFLPGSECQDCKGKCCREHGCVLAPADFFKDGTGPEKENIVKKLKNGDLYAIDRTGYEGGLLYYIRMRHKCYTFIGIDAIGECVMLGDNGCGFSFEERPLGGKALQSSPDFHCTQTYTLDKMAADWEPYSEVLSEIFNEYEELFYSDGTFDECDERYFEWLRNKKGDK